MSEQTRSTPLRQVEVIGREFSIVGEPGRRDRQMTPPHSNGAVEVQNRVGDIANVDHHAIVERPDYIWPGERGCRPRPAKRTGPCGFVPEIGGLATPAGK
jgi:hypothetical protein